MTKTKTNEKSPRRENDEGKTKGPAMATKSTLTPPELVRLKECESRIENGVQAMIDAGNALAEIRDSRLYREQYGTFEAYVKERWGQSRAHAYRIIHAAGIVSGLSPMGDITPTNERQARALEKIKWEWLRAVVWQAAIDRAGDSPTASDIDGVVSDLLAPMSFGMGTGEVDGTPFFVHVLPDEKRDGVELHLMSDTGELDKEGEPVFWGWKEKHATPWNQIGLRIREMLAELFPPADWDDEELIQKAESEGLSVGEGKRLKRAAFIRHGLSIPIQWQGAA